MANRYLLPCECGAKSTVETSQAGQEIACQACGTTLVAPTLRGLRELEQVTAQQQELAAKRTWGRSQGIRFSIGIGVVFVSLAVSAVLFHSRSQLNTEIPDVAPNVIALDDSRIDGMDAVQLFSEWKHSESTKLGEWQPLPFVQERETERMINNILIAMIVTAGLGAALSISAIFIKSSPARRTR